MLVNLQGLKLIPLLLVVVLASCSGRKARLMRQIDIHTDSIVYYHSLWEKITDSSAVEREAMQSIDPVEKIRRQQRAFRFQLQAAIHRHIVDSLKYEMVK